MPYIRFYSLEEDQEYQCEVSEETAADARKHGVMNISDTPFKGFRVVSRYKSERAKEAGEDTP